MLRRFGLILACLFLLVSCGQPINKGKLEKVGLLVPETINDQVWGSKGYKGMLNIQTDFGVEVFYKEGMDSFAVVALAVDEFKDKGVNLIFGHGNEYSEYFNAISANYPDIHFVSFNGDAKAKNTTSLNFKSYAMGFFGGMVASHMSKTGKIGVIGAFEWQPEIEGFYEGAKFENPQTEITIKYVEHWDDNKKALNILDQLIYSKIDVVYPAGDSYNVPVIEKLKENGLYAIGYVSDQSDLGESTVLTSTVQHVAILYDLVAKKYNDGQLSSGNLYFDFNDGVISMGDFSPTVDQAFIHKLDQYIAKYKESGQLPK